MASLGDPHRDLAGLELGHRALAVLERLPLRAIHAARHTSRRAASISVAMSASLNAMPWFMMIGLPNASRSLAYSSEYS